MLDDFNVIAQRDPTRLLDKTGEAYRALQWNPSIANPEFDNREIRSIVIVANGIQAIAAQIIAVDLRSQLDIPTEVISSLTLPRYINANSLVVICSDSNDFEASALKQIYQDTRARNCQIAVIGTGSLVEQANDDAVVIIETPTSPSFTETAFYALRAITRLLVHFGIASNQAHQDNLADLSSWLQDEWAISWHQKSPIHENFAKQFTLLALGKSTVFYGGPASYPLANAFKLLFARIAKNIAFSDQYPDFNHAAFAGWSSHPIEKPYLIVDLISEFDELNVPKRMRTSDRLLSGLRPKAFELQLFGDTYLAQAIWCLLFAEYTSIYVAILNNSAPASNILVEKYFSRLENQQ